jgi:hypothetical protein
MDKFRYGDRGGTLNYIFKDTVDNKNVYIVTEEF